MNTTPSILSLRDDERQRCEIWTRVMGYHRPVSSFNVGKQGEFQERRHFVEGHASAVPAVGIAVDPGTSLDSHATLPG
jgi:hypothetical protein